MKRRWGPFLSGLVFVVAITVGIPAAAMAAFVALGSGSGPTSAASFPAPGRPTVTAGGGTQVTVAWTGTALSTGKAVDSYLVRRTVGATTTTVCTTTTLTCTDTPTAAASYVVVARIGSWTSTSAATSYTPDTTPPTITNLRLSADTGSSSTDFVTTVAAQTLSGTTEAGATVRVTYRGGTVTTTAGSNGSFAVDLTLTVGTADITVQATDQAGNAVTVTQPVTFTAASSAASSVIVPGNTATSMQSISWQIPANANSQFCVTTVLTGSSTTPAAWSLLVDLDKPPFYGTTANRIYYQGSAQVQIAALPGDPTMARITGSSSPGNPWNAAWNNALLDSSKTLTVTLCDSSPEVPTLGDPSWYTTQVSQGTRTATMACTTIVATATTTAADNPFFFGWRGTIDLTAAKQYLVNTGRTLNYVAWNPSTSNGFQFTTSPTATSPVADSYQITSGRMTAIKAGTSTTITACVHAY